MAGIFFAFSSFIMNALGRLPPAQGIVAMQSINITVINPLFIATLFGTAAVCVGLAIFAVLRWQQPGAALVLVGGLLYLIGTIGVTAVFNVPLNNALANVEPSSVEGASVWANYLTNWTLWNHVRGAAALAAAAAFTLALCQRATQ